MEYLEIIGTIVGLIYLWLEYHASIYLWLASIVMPLIYIFIYHDAGLYADMGINIYYVIASIYGIICWRWGISRKNKKDASTALKITHTPTSRITPLSIISIALTFAIAYILITFTDSNVPWWDSVTTSLSIVAMWMMARKYIEQWWVWIVVDVISAGLYVYKELFFTAGLYALYAIIAYFGYKKWKELMLTQ
ncbi:MAG: nicotinamide mononucleotide transporter [Muribaculaceae bacterium]|nr:nicotinamide mononucleotide transporter [Muribaculaceae bacterium]